jgi:hypothetical protein
VGRWCPVSAECCRGVFEARKRTVAANVDRTILTRRELIARWEPALAVADVMTVWEDVSVVHWDSVCSLTTRQLHEMFRGTGLSHVVVVDHAEESQMHVKALLSRTALAQRLGH